MNTTGQTTDRRSRKSVNVHVKLCDFLSKVATQNDFDMMIPVGYTAADLIRHLARRLGDDFCKALLDKDGRLHPDYAIVIDTHLIPPRQLTDFSIKKNSLLSIIPIAGGG